MNDDYDDDDDYDQVDDYHCVGGEVTCGEGGEGLMAAA